MANVRIIGKKGSKARYNITKTAGIHLYRGQKTDAIINYGLAGENFRAFLKRYPSAKKIPIINKYVGLSKYSAIRRAENARIEVPETYMSLPRYCKLSNWIEKRVNSGQGKGIIKARGRGRITGKYYQKFINNRRYELRVHAFLWLSKEQWTVNKRVGPEDQIAWNFHQGGHFQSIKFPDKYPIFLEAKDMSENILNLLGMSFGAVDFIVDTDSKIYFIEVNSSPGFSELNMPTYIKAMAALKGMAPSEAGRYGRI